MTKVTEIECVEHYETDPTDLIIAVVKSVGVPSIHADWKNQQVVVDLAEEDESFSGRVRIDYVEESEGVQRHFLVETFDGTGPKTVSWNNIYEELGDILRAQKIDFDEDRDNKFAKRLSRR